MNEKTCREHFVHICNIFLRKKCLHTDGVGIVWFIGLFAEKRSAMISLLLNVSDAKSVFSSFPELNMQVACLFISFLSLLHLLSFKK